MQNYNQKSFCANGDVSVMCCNLSKVLQKYIYFYWANNQSLKMILVNKKSGKVLNS